jgi:hypothetical protein
MPNPIKSNPQLPVAQRAASCLLLCSTRITHYCALNRNCALDTPGGWRVRPNPGSKYQRRGFGFGHEEKKGSASGNTGCSASSIALHIFFVVFDPMTCA